MGEDWNQRYRPCAPCADCGTELYEKFWGNGGWARTETATDRPHGAEDCVRVLKATHLELRGSVARLKTAIDLLPYDTMNGKTVIDREKVRREIEAFLPALPGDSAGGI